MVNAILISLLIVTAVGTLIIMTLSWILMNIASTLLKVDIEILEVTKEISASSNSMDIKLEALEKLPIPKGYREVSR